MSALPQYDAPMTEADYLAFERASEFKHEFIDGEIIAFAGASPAHGFIASGVNAALFNQLRDHCKVSPSDLKVRTPSTGSFVYPDITVVCGEVQMAEDEKDVLLNPVVVVEVLSPSTEAYDRGLKFQRYREIASLQEYILIAQDAPHIELFLRQPDGTWQFSEAHGLEATLTLTSIDCTLVLAEVYKQVDFDAGEADDTPDTADE